MKKVFFSILAFIYIVIASGFSISSHYCMGRLSGVDYGYHAVDKCSKCGMENRPGCCHNEFKFVKLGVDQQTATSATPVFLQAEHTPMYWLSDLSISIQGLDKTPVAQPNAPPRLGLPPIYLSNCIFRI